MKKLLTVVLVLAMVLSLAACGGTDTTTAIRMFLTQAVATNGFPFEIKRQAETNPYAPMTEKEMLAKLKKSREQGKFRDADDVISDMRSKYGL